MADVAQSVPSPLAGLNLASEPEVARLAEGPARARLVLRANPATVARLLQWADVAVPPRINTARVTEQRVVLQLGPDEWWILSAGETPAALSHIVTQSAGGAAYSLVDVSDRTIGLILAGPAVEDVLASGCPLPLSLPACPVGRATRTLFAKAEIVLWRQALDRFHLEVGRSFAPYVAALLGSAIREEAALRRWRGDTTV
ncbi:MAG: sarcosine oxidase subunit gamma [Hyphomicrobiaceae bacterium]